MRISHSSALTALGFVFWGLGVLDAAMKLDGRVSHYMLVFLGLTCILVSACIKKIEARLSALENDTTTSRA